MRAPSRRSISLLRISIFAAAGAAAISQAHAQATINDETVTVPGDHSSPWNIPGTGELFVGTTGTGQLDVLSGGVVNGGPTYLGQSATGVGIINVGAGGVLYPGGLYIGDSGTGTLSISGGGIVDSASARVGFNTGSTGTATVSDAGSQWILSSAMYIGYDGTGTVNVQNGAALVVNDSMYVGYHEGDGTVNLSGGATITSGDVYLGYVGGSPTGTANVSGAGTQWNMGYLIVGDDGGAGELNISDGAHVITSSDATLGYYPTGITRGDATISGAGSLLHIGGDLTVGYSAEATVIVSDGAKLEVEGYSTISSDVTAPSSVTVTGHNSEWTTDGLYVGYYGVGTLNITDGASVSSSDDLYLGYTQWVDTHGIVTISGPGSKLSVDGDAHLSYEALATLTVSDGGLFDVTGTSTVGEGDVATVTVTGSGSKWISGAIEIGNYASSSYPNARGDVIVSNGGAVEAGSLGIGTGGSTTPGVGTLLVTGAGSSVDVTGAMTIGGYGTATATIADKASVSAASVSIAAENGSTGTLIFGAAAGEAPVAAGALDTPSISFGNGLGKMVFNITGSMVMDAALQGSNYAAQVNVRAGTVTFTGDASNFLGTTLVEGGKAVISNTFGGYVTAMGTGIIAGTGTGFSLAALDGGTISPGNSIGTLHSNGAIYFGADSNYVVEVNAAGQSDRIEALGPGQIDGGTVHVSGAPTLTTYTIITTGEGLTGTFSGLDSTSAFVDYRLAYDDYNVYLVVDGINSFTIAARTPNQYAVARALDQFPAGNPLFTAMLGQDIAGAGQALNALSGEIHASVGTALADDSRYVREAITGRLIQAYYGGSAGAGQPIVLAAAASTDVIDPSRMSLGAGDGASRVAPAGGNNLAYWSRAFGAWGQYEGNGNAATTDRNLGGFITGVDGAVGGGWRAGVTAGYMYTGLDSGARSSSANVDSYVLGGYAGGGLGGGFALRSGGTWTWHDIDTSRGVVFPGFNEWESANYTGDTGQLFAEVAYPFIGGNHVIEPFAGLAYVHVGTNGFTESGPIAGLTSGGSDDNLGYGTLGARAGTTMVWGGTTVIPHAALGWQYAFGDVTPFQALAFASTGIGMGIGGVPIAQNSALLEIGADALIGADATLGLSYIGQYASDVQDNGLRGRFNWKF